MSWPDTEKTGRRRTGVGRTHSGRPVKGTGIALLIGWGDLLAALDRPASQESDESSALAGGGNDR